MSAEMLRRAAALMRERAESASASPWSVTTDYGIAAPREEWDRCEGQQRIAGMQSPHRELWMCANADHIASWHPAVALAVAAAFEQHAIQHGDSAGRNECQWETWACEVTNAARAYLGES